MDGMEMTCFQIISNVGLARSSYIEAIHHAKVGGFDKAWTCIREGEEQFLTGHEAHQSLLQKEASGEKVEGTLLLIHAEDQLMSAEQFKIIAEEFIACYEKMKKLEQRGEE